MPLKPTSKPILNTFNPLQQLDDDEITPNFNRQASNPFQPLPGKLKKKTIARGSIAAVKLAEVQQSLPSFNDDSILDSSVDDPSSPSDTTTTTSSSSTVKTHIFSSVELSLFASEANNACAWHDEGDFGLPREVLV